MNFGICVTMRMDSTRLPGKCMSSISGRPAIYWLCRQLKFSDFPWVICTSEDESCNPIAEYCVLNDHLVFRGSEKDVLNRLVSAKMHFGFDHIIRITGDDIFVDPEYITKCVQQYDGSDFCYTNLPKGTDFQIIHGDYADQLSEQTLGRDTEYLTWYLNNAPRKQFVKFMPNDENYAFELDTPEDLQLLNGLVSSMSNKKFFRVENLLQYAESHPNMFPIKHTVDERVGYASPRC